MNMIRRFNKKNRNDIYKINLINSFYNISNNDINQLYFLLKHKNKTYLIILE